MRNATALILLPAAALSLTLGGCAAFGKKRGLDEFAVARNAPLIIPPDYSLTPPVAGTVSLSAEGAQGQAIEALFGGPAPRSAVESSILDATDRERATIGIRSTVGDNDTRVVDKGASTSTIIAAPQGDGTDASAQTPQ